MAGFPVSVLFVITVCSTATATEKLDNVSLSIDNAPTLFDQFNESSPEDNDKNLTVDIVNRDIHTTTDITHVQTNDSNRFDNEITNKQTHYDTTERGYQANRNSTVETHESEIKKDDLNENEEEIYCKKSNLGYIIRDAENLTKLMTSNKISDLFNIERYNLTQCVFKKPYGTILCEFIGIAYDYKPFISYDFFLRTVISFEIIRNEAETGVISDCGDKNVCSVRFTRVHMEKVDGSYTWQNGTKEFLGPTFMIFFLLGLEKMEWTTEFSAEVPVGILYMKSDCDENTRMQSSCINRVEIINFPKILDYNAFAYCPEFWKAFKMLTVGTLGSYNSFLTLKSNNESEGNFFSWYVRQILDDSGLKSLTLNSFNLEKVKTIMENMTVLKFLDLSDNNIRDLEADIFKQAPNVEHLDISSNKLEAIPQQISSLRHLKHLDISSNPIKYVNVQSNKVLSNLSNLKWLSLSHTNLKSLQNLHDLLRNDNSSILLDVLDVSYCNLTSVEDTEFLQQQTRLYNINLGGNNLSVIPPKMFLSFEYLKNISISNLLLTHAPKLEFGFDKTLELIDLSHNKLTSPEDILVSGKVRRLDLSFNSIEEWSDEAIFSLDTCLNGKYPKCNSTASADVWVDNLNLSYNSIPILTKSMANTLKNLEVVDLGENPFNCLDCNIVEFGNWIRQMEDNSSKVNVLSLGLENNLRCKVDEIANDTLLRDIWSLPEVCVHSNSWVTVGSIVGVLLLLSLLTAVMLVRYKFEMAYLVFMLRQKRRSSHVELVEGFEYDAFVCYSRHDRAWVMQEMVPTLEECTEKFKLCLHERDFILGSFISVNIMQSIQRSRFTVLVLSKGFIESQWCRWELEIANYKLFESGREFLILIELERLSEDTVPRHLKFLMDTRTYLEWPERGEDASTAWKRLRKNLGKSIHLQQEEAVFLNTSTESIL